ITEAIKNETTLSRRLESEIESLKDRVTGLERAVAEASTNQRLSVAVPVPQSQAGTHASMVSEVEFESLSQRLIQLERSMTENAASASDLESQGSTPQHEQSTQKSVTSTFDINNFTERLSRIDRTLAAVSQLLMSKPLDLLGFPVGADTERTFSLSINTPTVRPILALTTESLVTALSSLCLAVSVTSCAFRWHPEDQYSNDVNDQIVGTLSRVLATSESLKRLSLTYQQGSRVDEWSMSALPTGSTTRTRSPLATTIPTITLSHAESLVTALKSNPRSKLRALNLDGFSLDADALKYLGRVADSDPNFPDIEVSEREPERERDRTSTSSSSLAGAERRVLVNEMDDSYARAERFRARHEAVGFR
ncbi:hypothetical protein HDU93_000422, partial [Gonapodya sp. JEL0774]